jgi:hypothetical protein
MRSALTLVLSVGVLVSCTGTNPLVSPEEGERIARACQQQTQAVGTYSIRAAQGSSSLLGRIPRADAVKSLGGTQAGADAINACIQRTILGDQQRVESVRVGNTTVETYTYGTPPSKAATSRDREQILADMRREQLGERSFGCTQDAPVLFGGTQYCVKR